LQALFIPGFLRKITQVPILRVSFILYPVRK
jgi:hypothetical protein